MKKNSPLFVITCVIFFLYVVFYGYAFAGNSSRLLIIPLQIDSEKDFSFLSNGIDNMLSSRLTLKDKIVPVGRKNLEAAIKNIEGPINEKTAVNLADTLKADYVIFSSLKIADNKIVTNISFININKPEDRINFVKQGEKTGDIFSHVNLFCNQVNKKLFGRKISLIQKQKTDETPAELQSRKDPESLWPPEKEIMENLSSAITVTGGKSLKTWESNRLKIFIKGMATGDIDGDGINELVVITDKKLCVYKYIKKELEKIKEIKDASFDDIIGLDVADINQNGKAEIFVTNIIRKKIRPNSTVFEFNGSEFVKIFDHAEWFFRVLRLPETGDILLGQEYAEKDVFKPGVYELKFIDGLYVPVQRRSLPEQMIIYGFTFGDIFNTKSEAVVTFAKNDFIRILDKNGNEKWLSNEPYGGSINGIEYYTKAEEAKGKDKKSKASMKTLNRITLPQRLFIADLDNNGINELVTVSNQNFTKRYFTGKRFYLNGHVECLAWNGYKLQAEWMSKKYSGYISDYDIGDLDNNGKIEIICSVVAKTDSMLTRPKSYIIIMELN